MNDGDSIRVATIHISEAREMSRQHESASAYHTIRVEPGAYPVESVKTRYGDRCIVATFSGICVHSGYGGKRYHEQEGQPSTVTRQPSRYELRSGSYCGGRVEIHDDAAIDAACEV
jgi:hypothetical protein